MMGLSPPSRPQGEHTVRAPSGMDKGKKDQPSLRGQEFLSAVKHGDVTKVDALLKQGTPNDVINNKNDTPLTLVLKQFLGPTEPNNSLLKVLDVLLAAKADPNKCNGKGDSPLHIAVKTQNPELVQQLVGAGAKLEVCDAEGRSPLLRAVSRANFVMMSVLSNCGANMRAVDNYGRNALMIALKDYLPKEKTFALLSVDKDQVNYQAPDGQTPLIVAAVRAYHKAIRYLLEAGADPLLGDKRSKTALEILLRTQSRISKDRVRDMRKRRNVGMAAYQRGMDMPTGGVRALIRHGALQCLPTEHYFTLYKMILDGDRQLAQLLVTKGMAPLCVDLSQYVSTSDLSLSVRRNCSPLAAALLGNKLAIARYFLDNWFLTPCDLAGSTHITHIRAFQFNRGQSTTVDFIDEHLSQPMRLLQLSFISVSALLGEMIGREERVRQLSLPVVWQERLLFRKELHPMQLESTDSDGGGGGDDDEDEFEEYVVDDDDDEEEEEDEDDNDEDDDDDEDEY